MIRDPLPHKVTALEKYTIQKVICGSDQTFCLAASTTGEAGTHCFSWGSNQNAKLGHSFFKPTPSDGQAASSIQIVK
jgi:alpha-tubulin suppressor-like RCC1 family protein